FALMNLNPFRYLYISSSFTSMLGRQPADVDDGRSLMEELIHPDDRGAWEVQRAAIATGDPVQAEIRITRHDGRQRWLRIVSTPVDNPTGPPERCVVTIE